MKATDLMLGDWVIYHDSGRCSDGSMWGANRLCQVIGINENLISVEWTCEDGDKEIEGHISLVDVSPIPLTSEILEKNGFDFEFWKRGNMYCGCFNEDKRHSLELSIYESGDIDWTINGCEYVIAPLKYVHELQHALKLCGIEKEIVC